MGFLYGCGEITIMDCLLSKAMNGWRNFSKFEQMREKIDHENNLKACKCKRANTRDIWQHLKVKSVKYVFHRATKLYNEQYLGSVESSPYHFVGNGISHYSLFPENDKKTNR